MRKTIHIPHLGFAVFVVPKPKSCTGYARTLFSKDGQSVKLLLPKGCTASALAHELVHALQAMCRHYHIDFAQEDEHMGYLMQWLMEKILEGRKTVR